MSQRDEPRFRRVNGIPAQEIDGQAVIVVPARREIHELDEVGTLIWRRLDRRCSLSDLERAVCAEFEVAPAKARKDVRAFVKELEGKGLVSRK